MLRIALQSKGRLNEKSLELLREAGISVEENNRKLLSKSFREMPSFPGHSQIYRVPWTRIFRREEDSHILSWHIEVIFRK